MELFNLTCTTCHKRLKVVDAAMVGQLSICPHCGSMVLIEAPAPGSVAADPVDDVEATLGGAAETPAAPPLVPPTSEPPVIRAPGAPPVLPTARHAPVAPPPLPTATETGPRNVSESLAIRDSAIVEAEVNTTELAAEPSANCPVEPTAAAPPCQELAPQELAPQELALVELPASSESPQPPAETAEKSVGKAGGAAAGSRREGLMIVGATAAGLALALTVFGLVATWNSPSSPTTGVAERPNVTPPAPSPSPSAQPPLSINGAPPTNVLSGDPSTAAPPQVSGPQVPAPSAVPPTPSKSGAADTIPAQTPPPPLPAAGAVAKTTSQDPAGKPATTDSAATVPGFSPFAPFMDTTPIAPAQPAAESAPDQPAGAEAVPAPPDPPAVPRPAPRQVHVAQRLKDEIPAIEFTQTPLLDLVQFLASFSTIPITLDPDALLLVKVTPQTPVTVKLDKSNVEQVLTAALQPLRLGYVVTDDQLRVTRVPPTNGAQRQHKHAVPDLVGDDSRRLAQLADLIMAMVAPASWELHGGAGVLTGDMPSLVIQQDDTGLFRTLLFCDRLRVARGLPPQSGFNPELFKLTPRNASAAQALAKRVTLNYLAPTPLIRILDQVRKDTGVQVLVDWHAVAELGWNPDAETTLAAQNQTLAQALDSLLHPMDLTYRVIDKQILEVTTPAQLTACWDVEFYPVGPLLAQSQTPDALLERLHKELGLAAAGAAAPGGMLNFDAPSQHLIAALPQPQQRRLAELLAQRQTK